ncbi:hypothetical protein SLEP1_g46534 [Rubroshorea leprosula]|uniref:Retrotransposon gag domain-containing protein n=1 Tax=Rubroshorea leprosula TaxID=152421 RepID=A0AAV5LML6_9ROSI|nr:hypothetical protein SLEP1_g46534 [Rubroshorea leprosula]
MVNTRSIRARNSSQPLGRAPQQNPKPIQHVPALSESQGQSHIAPAQQPLPDDVTRCLDSLEKLVVEQRGAPPPRHAADSIPHPLNTTITLEPYPAGFRITQLETYDGTKDPDDHLHAFYSCMQTQNASDALIRRLIRKTTSELMRVRQRDGESLKNFMSRFNDAKPAPSKNQNPDWRDENPSKKRMKIAQNRGPMSTSAPRFERPNSTPPQQFEGKPSVNWTPFNLPWSPIFIQIKNKMDLKRPGPMRTAVANRDHTRYCDFHQDHGHTTEQCNSLKSKLESLAHKGLLNKYIQRAEQPRFVREQRPQPQGVRGLEAGGLSSKQRKLYVREVKHQNRAQKWKFDDVEWKNQPITFTSADLDIVVTPHNDPLVTSVMINNCEVQHVLVDTRSAPDIMYFHCFESLGLDPALLQRYDGPIYGFNNHPVPVEGVLTMNVAFGSGRNYVTPSVRFRVVKMASSFNVVM